MAWRALVVAARRQPDRPGARRLSCKLFGWRDRRGWRRDDAGRVHFDAAIGGLSFSAPQSGVDLCQSADSAGATHDFGGRDAGGDQWLTGRNLAGPGLVMGELAWADMDHLTCELGSRVARGKPANWNLQH